MTIGAQGGSDGPETGQIIGFMLPDLIVQERLRAGWRAVQRNPELITDVITRLDEDYQRLFKDSLTRGVEDGRFLPIYGGWPMEPGNIPGIGVLLLPESEDASRQPIGDLGYFANGDGTRTRVQGTFERAVIQMTHYSTNQRGSTLLAQITKWLLFQMRELLLEDGLKEQVVTLSNAEPIEEEFMSDFLFSTIVRLSCTYQDTWGVVEGPIISGVEVTIYPEGDTEVSF
jgi:hypothetical protein